MHSASTTARNDQNCRYTLYHPSLMPNKISNLRTVYKPYKNRDKRKESVIDRRIRDVDENHIRQAARNQVTPHKSSRSHKSRTLG